MSRESVSRQDIGQEGNRQHDAADNKHGPPDADTDIERGAPEWHPAEENVILTCKKAADHCKMNNEKIEKLAVKYSVSNPRIPTTLVSSSNPENIKRNIRGAESSLNEELLGQVLEILRPAHRKTWENS